VCQLKIGRISVCQSKWLAHQRVSAQDGGAASFVSSRLWPISISNSVYQFNAGGASACISPGLEGISVCQLNACGASLGLSSGFGCNSVGQLNGCGASSGLGCTSVYKFRLVWHQRVSVQDDGATSCVISGFGCIFVCQLRLGLHERVSVQEASLISRSWRWAQSGVSAIRLISRSSGQLEAGGGLICGQCKCNQVAHDWQGGRTR